MIGRIVSDELGIGIMNKKEKIVQDNGSVFILVLWSLFFLGALAMVVATIVASSVRLSIHVKDVNTASRLARSGVNLAITEIVGNVTNWEVSVGGEMAGDEDLFKDNDELVGGIFSVYYEYISADSGMLVTNYGAIDESFKKNINNLSVIEMKDIFKKIAAAEKLNINAGSLADEVYNSRNTTDGSDLHSYHCFRKGSEGKFELLQELLLLKSFENNVGLFSKLEPYLTVYPEGCYKATSVGQSLAEAGTSGRYELLDEVKIDFVFDSRSGKIIYWHEY